MSPFALLSVFGLFKFFVDRASVTNMSNAMKVVGAALSESSRLNPTDKYRLLVDISSKLASPLGVDLTPPSFGRRLGKLAHEMYRYFIPGFARTGLFIPAYIITYPFRWVLHKQKMDAIRERTRELVIKGLWSFFLPLSLGYLAACLLVEEVEYVKVSNGQDWNAPNVLQQTVRRIVIGAGPFSFQLPFHPALKISLQVIIGFAMFHTASFLLILINYKDLAPAESSA